MSLFIPHWDKKFLKYGNHTGPILFHICFEFLSARWLKLLVNWVSKQILRVKYTQEGATNFLCLFIIEEHREATL